MALRYEILMDKKENPRKCTIAPLDGRTDFHIRYFDHKPIAAFSSDVLLHIDGECLSGLGSSGISSVAVIDCNWKLVAPTIPRIAKPLPRLVKIPGCFVTAYPRRNKLGKDPDGGLATIEALFIAAAFLGTWDETLLNKYHFKTEFLEMNRGMWERYRLPPAPLALW